MPRPPITTTPFRLQQVLEADLRSVCDNSTCFSLQGCAVLLICLGVNLQKQMCFIYGRSVGSTVLGIKITCNLLHRGQH
jgi:hypothetical protein